MRKERLVLVLMCALMGFGVANGAIMHGIPGGDFSAPLFPDGKPIGFVDGGQWNYYEASATASNVAGTGAARHGEVTLDWGWRAASFWYTDDQPTPVNEKWTISADITGSLSSSSATSPGRWFGLMDVTRNNWIFYMKFTPDNYIEWYTPTETGYFASATGIDDGVYRTASFSYDPVTGSAKGTFGNETVFDTTTSTGLFAQTVFFMNYAPSQGIGTFFVDNVTAVPEPKTLGLVGAGSLLLRRKW